MKSVRFINALAIVVLIGTAAWVYRIKYEATWQAEEVARLERQIARERAAVAVLTAEWTHLIRPDRVQALVDHHLGLKPADPRQIVVATALPMRPPKIDAIGDTIASLGFEDVVPTGGKEDPIARTIEAMGLHMPSEDDRIARMIDALGIGDPTVTGSTPR
jgi:hypothetical protein